jgi:hypothetical protein
VNNLAEYKLSYTASQIDAKLGKIDGLAAKSELPTKTSELTNDSDFTTKQYVDDAVANIDIPEVDLTDYALKSEIPTDYLKTIPAEYVTESELTAKKYLTSYTETDPTVPAWAKAASKPTYTASEVGALPNTTVIPTVPTKVSAFTNDAGYLTQHQSLAAYAKTADLGDLATKDSLTASEVGADASGTASSAVSAHNSDGTAHSDIREQISQLSSEKANLTDRVDGLEQDVIDIQAENLQQAPLYANSIEECTDTSKMYVLPDGFIYAYMKVATSGGSVAYTNQVPTSTDTDGSIYNGTGYKDNARLSSSGGVSGSAQNGSVVTGFMPWVSMGTIRIKGARWMHRNGEHYYINLYDSSKAFIYGVSASAAETDDGSAFGAVENIYDAATGVTTVDVSAVPAQTAIGDAFRNAAYFRINAYGKGADLIVTVNQEIKESTTPTETYQWVNTGHAFVPADYEDRIVVLENITTENTEDINQLKEQVNDIVDGNTEISASTKFDPTVYELPVLYLTGDTSPIAVSKDNKVTLNYSYEGRNGTCTLKGQGATSYKMAKAFVDQGKAGKFNYTIKFDNAFEAAEGWTAQSKYCLKANWIDHTHSRNIVSAKLWGLMVKNRATQNTNLSGLVNGGAIDGFPIVIMLNGEFHGLYTFNIPKDGWMFGMEEDATKTQAIVCASDHSNCTQFKSAGMSGFEVEFASDEDNVDWVTTSMNRLITACINSDGKDLDTTIANYLDWESAIDYYIFIVLIKGTDMVDKNYLLTTFDGTKWYFSAYDIDSTYGLNWDGSGLTRAVSNCNFVECAESHRVYELIKKYKVSALKSRYEELRSNILSETRICQYFENFAWDISTPILLEDVKKYPTIRGSSVNGIDQICRWVRQRLEVADEWVNAL